MTLKYASKWKLLVFAVFAAAKAMQAVFIAYVFQEFINFAGNPKGSLLQLTIKAVVGIVLFACLALIYQIMQANIIKDVNLKIKEQATEYLLYSDNANPKLDLSFMTNDLKQVESHRVEAELDIVFRSAVRCGFCGGHAVFLGPVIDLPGRLPGSRPFAEYFRAKN